jgi:hypothetical protein
MIDNFFSNLFFTLQARYILIIIQKQWKGTSTFKNPINSKKKESNISSTCNLLEGYKLNCELCVNSHESI